MASLKKTPLYSRSSPPPRAVTPATHVDAPAGGGGRRTSRGRRAWAGWLLALALAAGLGWFAHRAAATGAPLSMAQIDRAIRRSIQERQLRAPTAQAYAAILPSVPRTPKPPGTMIP